MKMLHFVFTWLVFHALALAACVCVTGLLSLFLNLPNWLMVGVALWILVSLGALLIPDEQFFRTGRRRL